MASEAVERRSSVCRFRHFARGRCADEGDELTGACTCHAHYLSLRKQRAKGGPRGLERGCPHIGDFTGIPLPSVANQLRELAILSISEGRSACLVPE